ncbi:protein stum homolog [Aplysia californica]|uniref:Protein stum homolog n=1 Tax=Aplysia californica TaxID=6500 RepID=A0ABM1A7I9_APLCA|nr:protein stum homolog [Aplysia californica]
MSVTGHSARGSLQVSRTDRGSMPGEDAEILEVNEKHGPLYNAIPCMPVGVAVVLCILNIVIPGLGTFFSAWTCLCGCKTKLGKPAKAFCLNLLSALLQMITFVFIVGWVWSIIWGMNFVQIATQTEREPTKIPYYVRRQSSVVE